MLDRFPGVDRRVKRLVGTEAVMVYRRPAAGSKTSSGSGPGGGVLSVEKAAESYSATPPVSRERALELTLQWAHAARLN